MAYYGNSPDLFDLDELVNYVQDTSQQPDVITDDFQSFFDALDDSRNVLYPPEDTQRQHFGHLDCYHQESNFAQQFPGSEAQFESQNVFELGNTSDGFTSPSQASCDDLLASVIESEIGDVSDFSYQDSYPSGSSCSSQMEVSPVPPVYVADVPMPVEPVVQSTEELFQVLIEKGKPVESPPFNVSSSFSSNFLLIGLNLMFMFFSLQFSSGLNKLFANKDSKCPVQFKTAIPAQFEGQYWIRVYVSFTEREDQCDPVASCPNDAHRGPLMQCDLMGAEHQPIKIRGVVHNSILLPLNAKDGFLCATANFTFICYCTHPSIGRKPIQLHFTVEDVRYVGSVVAEKIIDLKISACPGRDRKDEENKKGISPN